MHSNDRILTLSIKVMKHQLYDLDRWYGCGDIAVEQTDLHF